MNARPESLAELVAQRIATLGVSQVDYAIRMGVERSVLHNVLSGKSLSTSDTDQPSASRIFAVS